MLQQQIPRTQKPKGIFCYCCFHLPKLNQPFIWRSLNSLVLKDHTGVLVRNVCGLRGHGEQNKQKSSITEELEVVVLETRHRLWSTRVHFVFLRSAVRGASLVLHGDCESCCAAKPQWYSSQRVGNDGSVIRCIIRNCWPNSITITAIWLPLLFLGGGRKKSLCKEVISFCRLFTCAIIIFGACSILSQLSLRVASVVFALWQLSRARSEFEEYCCSPPRYDFQWLVVTCACLCLFFISSFRVIEKSYPKLSVWCRWHCVCTIRRSPTKDNFK